MMLGKGEERPTDAWCDYQVVLQKSTLNGQLQSIAFHANPKGTEGAHLGLGMTGSQVVGKLHDTDNTARAAHKHFIVTNAQCFPHCEHAELSTYSCVESGIGIACYSM